MTKKKNPGPFTTPFPQFACSGDFITCECGPYTLRATIHSDSDSGPPDKQDDGFWPSLDPKSAGYIGPKSQRALQRATAKAKAALEGWKKDEWFYCGVSVTVTCGDVVLVPDYHAAIWGIECNHPYAKDNRYLLQVANELSFEALTIARAKMQELGAKPAVNSHAALVAALEKIRDYPANSNSEPDTMGDALDAIQEIARAAVAEAQTLNA